MEKSTTLPEETTLNDDEEQEASTRAGECYRDISQMRLFLLASLNRLHSRESAIKRDTLPEVAEIHSDCLQLASEDIECESMRATYATVSIQAEAADSERSRLWRRMLADTGRMWLERSRSVERLAHRLEAAFLRHVIKFADGADCGDPELDARARRLWLLVEALVELQERIDYSLSCEFELCRDRLREFLANDRQHKSPSNGVGHQRANFNGHAETAAGNFWPTPAGASGLQSVQLQPDPWYRSRWFLWFLGIVVLAAVAATLWQSMFRTGSCWDFDLYGLNDAEPRPY